MTAVTTTGTLALTHSFTLLKLATCLFTAGAPLLCSALHLRLAVLLDNAAPSGSASSPATQLRSSLNQPHRTAGAQEQLASLPRSSQLRSSRPLTTATGDAGSHPDLNLPADSSSYVGGGIRHRQEGIHHRQTSHAPCHRRTAAGQLCCNSTHHLQQLGRRQVAPAPAGRQAGDIHHRRSLRQRTAGHPS